MSIRVKILILILITTLIAVGGYLYFNFSNEGNIQENIEKRLEMEMEPSEDERDTDDPNDMKVLPEPPKPGETNEQYDYNNPPRGEDDNDPNAIMEKQ